MPARVTVLASGAGSLLQALLDAPARSADYEVVGFITDNPNAFAIQRAAQAGVPVAVIALTDFADRPAWNAALADAVADTHPDWVVSAGFMRILGAPVLERFPGRIINTHPALLPNFPGAHAVRDALAAGAVETGSTVHFVDAGVDTGPVIAQRAVAIEPNDDEPALHERIKTIERELLVQTVVELSQGKLHLKGREVVRHD